MSYILKVKINDNWVDIPAIKGDSGVIPYTSADAGKLLAVNSQGTDLEWGPRIVAMTESQYEHITPDPNTYYFIYEAESSE